MVKSLGLFHIEDAEKLKELLRQNGIETELKQPELDYKSDPILQVRPSSLDEAIKGLQGCFDVAVPDTRFSEAELIKKKGGILTVQESVDQLPVSPKNLQNLLNISKAWWLFSGLAGPTIKTGVGEGVKMTFTDWVQWKKIIFHPDTFLYFKKNVQRKFWLTFLLCSGASLLITWLYFGIYKSVHIPFGYFLLGWLELCFLTLAAVFKERFGSVVGIAFGVIGTMSLLIVILALVFLL